MVILKFDSGLKGGRTTFGVDGLLGSDVHSPQEDLKLLEKLLFRTFHSFNFKKGLSTHYSELVCEALMKNIQGGSCYEFRFVLGVDIGTEITLLDLGLSESKLTQLLR